IEHVFRSDLLEQLGFVPDLSISSLRPVAKGVALGLLSTLLFTLWPLLTVRNIKPVAILRRDVETIVLDHPRSHVSVWKRWWPHDRLKICSAFALILGFAGISIWQAESWSLGLLFLGALALSVVLLAVSAKLLVSALRLLPIPTSLSVRQ